MSIKATFRSIRDNYVINQVKRAKIPDFPASEVCRIRVLFSGRVQKIGFRLEVCEMAKRLGLTGYCQNLDSGEVLAELQGPEKKIKFLISFMESLVRIKIISKTINKIDVQPEETDFLKK